MQFITLIFAAVLACASADVFVPRDFDRYPEFYRQPQIRHPRDTTWETSAGGGKVFGTLGNTDDSLFGRGGYKADIFNDHRGRLEGQAYGSRVLGAGGDSTNYGGKLDWTGSHGRLSGDVHREIGGRSGVDVVGEGIWKLDKNTRFATGGTLHKTFGHDRPELGWQGRIEHDF